MSGPDEELLALVGACLERFGRNCTLRLQIPGAEAKFRFPDPPPGPPTTTKENSR